MKIVIYGLGSGRNLIEKFLKHENMIVGYTDSDSNLDTFEGKRFINRENLSKTEFDYLIFAIRNENIVIEIKRQLVTLYGIEEKKILDFYELIRKCVPQQKVDRIYCMDNLQGLVLGISHAQKGINPRLLPGKCANLAVSSQDIYYNLLTLQYCKNSYLDKIKNLQYVIIDLFDYFYFNVDVSLNASAIAYFTKFGGLRENYHHLNDNHHVELEKKLSLYNEKYVTAEQSQKNIDFIKSLNLFHKDLLQEILSDFFQTKGSLDSSVVFREEDFPVLSKKRYEKTICENKESFHRLLQELYDINSNMQVFFVLIPRYYLAEKTLQQVYKNWEKEFYGFIESYQKKYGYQFFDFKNELEISGNPEYYYDIEHLNNRGADAFTKLLIQKCDIKIYK